MSRDRYLLTVNIKACAQCGLVYTGRSLSEGALAEFYRHEYRHFYEDISRVTTSYIYATRDKLKASYRLARIRQQVGEISGVVEIGCGLGYFLYECRQHGIQHLVGFESGDLFSNYANNTLGLDGFVINADYRACDWPFPQANVYALFHVLEHLPAPGQLLDWVAKRIGHGWLVIEVPDIAGHWDELGRLNFHFGHRMYFSADSLEQLLRRHGFGICAFVSDDDDGIYPGNLRVFARRLDTPDTEFLVPVGIGREAICSKMRASRRGKWRNSLLACALRQLRPWDQP